MLTDSKEVGLAIGQILGTELFGFDDLHYGLWPKGLKPTLKNFAEAQENYSVRLMETIPSGVHSILDVGAGSGRQAERLISRGYSVDCISPSPHLAEQVEKRLGTRARIFPNTIETCKLDRNYDLVLFSESFQYVDMNAALSVALAALNPGGFILISDFFKRTNGPAGPLGGGHLWSEFVEIISDLALVKILDSDITAETAPTIGMFSQILNSAARPVRDLICQFIEHRHPSIYRFLAWKFRERFKRIDGKYFSGDLTTENFALYKTYRLLLFQKRI